MDDTEGYYLQLQAINQLLEDSPEGADKTELFGLKQNIEELLSLTTSSNKIIEKPSGQNTSTANNKEKNKENDSAKLDEEYAMFMAEIAKEESTVIISDDSRNGDEEIETKHRTSVLKESNSFKELEGKKFKAPHKHQWGQVVYHNAMVCFVPDEIPSNKEFQVKVLFLNPTHKEMQPCPYYFHSEKDCNYTSDECGYSHGELVPFSSLQEYVEPNFEDLTTGSHVLAKQSNDLWCRAKINRIYEERCLVKFDSKNVDNKLYAEVKLAHILPMDMSENVSDHSSESSDCDIKEDFDVLCEKDIMDAKKRREELINKSLMYTPESQRLGDWEKHTRGIGSRLMQKMGYIVGNGLGKDGSGIIRPVTALVLPAGKSLDYCMNLKEKLNNPNLFNAEEVRVKRKVRAPRNIRKMRRMEAKHGRRQFKKMERMEKLDLIKFVEFRFAVDLTARFFTEEQEFELLRKNLKNGSDQDIHKASFMVDERIKKCMVDIEEKKLHIKKLKELHLLKDIQKFEKKLSNKEYDIKMFKTYAVTIQNEMDRRKNKKEMAVF